MNIMGMDIMLMMFLLAKISLLMALAVLMDKESLSGESRLSAGNILYEQVALSLLLYANPA